MIILKAYQYFFYTLYRFFETSTYSRWWSEWKAYVSMLALSLWLYSAIETSLHYFLEIPVKTSNTKIDLITAIFLIIVGVSNWFLFEQNDKWKEVVKEYNSLSKKQRRQKGLIVWIIIIAIIVFYWFISLPLLGKLEYE